MSEPVKEYLFNRVIELKAQLNKQEAREKEKDRRHEETIAELTRRLGVEAL